MNGTAIILASILAAMPNGPVPDGKPVETMEGIDIFNIGVDAASTNIRTRNNEMQKHITVTAWQNMPYSGVRTEQGKYIGEGYAFYLLHLIQERLNFTYDIVLPEPENLGVHESKNYTGVVKLLQDKKVDMAVSFIPYILELTEVMSYSAIIDDIGVTFMMKRPSYSAIGSGLMAPFTRTVWICILIALIIFGPVIFIIIFFRSHVEERRGHERYSLITCWWFAYGALLKQGAVVEPVTDVSRMLFGTWWIFIMVLTSFYTANLTAFLTLSLFTLPYDSVEDIIVARQEWFAYKGQIVEETLQFAKPDDHKDIHQLRNSYRDHLGMYINKESTDANVYRYLQDEKLFFCEVQLVQKMLYEDYKMRRARRIKESKRCEYVQLPGVLYSKYRAFGFPHNSPIVDHINEQIQVVPDGPPGPDYSVPLKAFISGSDNYFPIVLYRFYSMRLNEMCTTILLHIIEVGMVKHLSAMDLPNVRYCPLDLKSTERQLRNNDFMLTYKIIGTGYGLGGIMFVAEVIYRFGQKRKLWGRNCLCCSSQMIQDIETFDNKKDKRESAFNEKDLPKIGNDFSGDDKMWANQRNFWMVKEAIGDNKFRPTGETPPPLYEFAS